MSESTFAILTTGKMVCTPMGMV